MSFFGRHGRGQDLNPERPRGVHSPRGASGHHRRGGGATFWQTHPHVLRLEARPANLEGRGEVTVRDLVRNALHMRPERIIIGEVPAPRHSICCRP